MVGIYDNILSEHLQMETESTTLDKTNRLMTERSSKRAAGKPEQAHKR